MVIESIHDCNIFGADVLTVIDHKHVLMLADSCPVSTYASHKISGSE